MTLRCRKKAILLSVAKVERNGKPTLDEKRVWQSFQGQYCFKMRFANLYLISYYTVC